MESLKRKWNSCRGASILLALLFLLVCVMAGTSVLMAAASNAGKIRSNKEEQQMYFTLISAVNLLCDELQSVEYVGQYTITDSGPVASDRPNSSGDYYTDRTYTYTQVEGALSHRTSGYKIKSDDWSIEDAVTGKDMENILPLREYWDYVFAKLFDDSIEGDEGDYNRDKIKKFESTDIFEKEKVNSYDLKLTLDSNTVTVKVTVGKRNGTDTIILKAYLGDLGVRATLKPTGKGPNSLVLIDPSEIANEKWIPLSVGRYYKGETEHVTWELDEIEKIGGSG